jgi:hypothetical protein
MEDQILEGFVTDFNNEYSLNFDSDKLFEYFVNYVIISKKYPKEFNIDDISPGGSGDIGFDGFVFLVNGNIIKDSEEIEYLLRNNDSLDVNIIIIQTKNSRKFKADQVGTLIFGVKNFFNKDAIIQENNDIQLLRQIKNKIFSNVIALNSAPSLEIYFVTKGKWENPKDIQGRVDLELVEIKEKRLFSQINFDFYDAEKLKDSYRELKRKMTKELSYYKCIPLPGINGIRQSFIGIVHVKDYMNLITDSDGNLVKSLFYDNVRDFQGNNKVNSEIAYTLQSSELQTCLCVLNNGITIVAKKIETIGEKMKIIDFQIVNGCQTSHVIYNNKAIISAETSIIVKIIETTDIDVSNNIIMANNKQTEVKSEAFESIYPFHKDLEEFYKSIAKKIEHPIYYERRSKQYDGVPGIPKNQVVTLSAQIRAYASTFLAQPHSTHRYFAELLDSNRRSMFVQGQNLEYYYFSALLLNRTEFFLHKNANNEILKKFKYQIIYLIYIMVEIQLRQNKSNYIKAIEYFANNRNFSKLFNDSCEIISEEIRNNSLSPYQASRTKSFTDILREKLYK